MSTTQFLSEVWEQLAPLRQDIDETYPNISDVEAVQFRGFNESSLNSPEEQGDISLWVNMESGTTENAGLENRNKDLLDAVWTQLLSKLGGNLDRVMIAPSGGSLYIPGVYPKSTDSNEHMPYFQVR